MGYDANTGHQIKVVYSLDGAEITNVGNFYSDRHLNGRTREDSKKDHLDYVKNNISKDGNGDFESKGQKVLAIIDVVDKRRLDEVDLINPLTSGIDKTALSQSKENLTKAKNIIKILPKHCVHLKVGEIDNTPSYKSTFWAIGLKGDESRWRNIENIENLKNVRGWKGNNVFTKRGDEEGINYNQLVTKNPTKAQALKELKARKDMVGVQLSNLEKHAANNESDAGYKSLKHDYEVIQNDIKTIQDGEYNPRIMDKYHSKMLEFAYPVDDCGLSVEQLELFFGLYEGVVNWDYGIDDYINEGADQNYLTDNEAKRTLAAVSKNIINDSKKQISQYTANIYANVITKNLLDKWAPGYKKFSIILDNFKADNVIEFKTPTMDQSFISRFIDGKETMNGFLHRNPEIKIKMSPKIFEGMKDKDDAYKFFRAAIRYYAEGAEKYAEKLCKEFHKMNNEMKKLVQNTKLSGIVSLPLQMLFTFSNVSIDDVYTFTISQEDINAVNTFVRGIYTNYASPEKEKKEILDGLRKVIDSFNESTTDMEFNYLPSELEKLYEGTYNTSLSRYKEQFISENVDITWNNHINPEIRLLQEKTHMKKLKKIPADLVAYISIEAECIKDANDKMMIASYCISKLEIVEWYIELLETSSKKYLVPHSLPYLQTLRTQLLACYKKIMDVKIVNPNDRPIIDIKYPDELKR